MQSGGSRGSSVATANLGAGSFVQRPSVVSAGRRSKGTGRYRRVNTTGVVESPYSTQCVTGEFSKRRIQSLTPTSLHRIVRDTVKNLDIVREHQSRVNLERLEFLYEYKRTAHLREYIKTDDGYEGDLPMRVRMWVSAAAGTIEDLEGHKFDLDGPTDLAPVTMAVYREKGLLKVCDIQTIALRRYIRRSITPPLSSMIGELDQRGIIMASVIKPDEYRRYESAFYPTSTYSLTATLQDLSAKGIMRLCVLEDEKLRAYDEHHTKCALLKWFDMFEGEGIPKLDEEEIPIDPGKLRRMHNRTHLEGLYHTRLDSVVLKVGEVDAAVLDTIDLSILRTIGDLPIGSTLDMWALVDIENGHIDRIVYPDSDLKIVYPDIAFPEMQFGIATFTVDMRDADMLVVSWDTAQQDLVVKGLDGKIRSEFKRQHVIVYKPGDNSLRLDEQGNLMTPSQWLGNVPEESPRRDTRKPTTALSSLTPKPRDESTGGDYAMEASGMGPDGVKDWW